MIDFNQYVAKRLLAGCTSIALDELAGGQTVHSTDMKRLLGSSYAAYDEEAKTDLSISASKAAIEWNDKRDDLMRRIGFAINRKQLSAETRRQFVNEAERLVESYRERIEGTPDEAAFIVYEADIHAPANEAYQAAREVIEEFPLPRLKKTGEFGEDSYRREIQRRYLQDLFGELEGPPEEEPKGETRSFLLDRLKRQDDIW
ncbi:hypothetical protein [Shinella sedimenti]|uniref:Uncharacterized protein n=1 Tax=Shinella sedimenti TaxID=2919913 RepID=A0ABT0CTE2_9HYPH|nr:hypothetical protein [Shinella sedimenti]MCJ8151863.1 hypothetical protein [Shinella sedimenti]